MIHIRLFRRLKDVEWVMRILRIDRIEFELKDDSLWLNVYRNKDYHIISIADPNYKLKRGCIYSKNKGGKK